MSFRGSGSGKQIRSAARGSRVGGDPLRTSRLAQAEFSPHGANDSEDPQEGHDLIVMELARVKEIGGLDESMIRERTDNDARRPEHAEDHEWGPPCFHKVENENADEGAAPTATMDSRIEI